MVSRRPSVPHVKTSQKEEREGKKNQNGQGPAKQTHTCPSVKVAALYSGTSGETTSVLRDFPCGGAQAIEVNADSILRHGEAPMHNAPPSSLVNDPSAAPFQADHRGLL
ncbi:hypothetical protein GGTG_05395 [Gaeumannomyces tritici R3-111a-1]|uniref:Uncharacterized protein n=1 Tax=Gaeumannomyces tritici (strain R3-111a-1) TaxID=644352 RepID=J3NVT3_GAET3|nr:hypothetical protein GGTG_05395 [Gaeumannomyces tritici R3-111a-1]EJT75462.1 hypothetical protein GGTG_05395 [Gaeumannomyces tritici R3-111a-1]